MLVPSGSVEGFQYRESELTGPLCLMVQGKMLGVTVLFVEVDWMASMAASCGVGDESLLMRRALKIRVKVTRFDASKVAIAESGSARCPCQEI